ncbi:hypothetical protein ACQ4PT_062985 [Festuca glaucescens]
MVQGVSLSSLEEQTPPRLVAPPVPTAHGCTDAAPGSRRGRRLAASSRRSTGGNVFVVSVGPYHQLESRPSSLITLEKKEAIVNFLSEPMFRLGINNTLQWARARGEEATARGWYRGNMGSEERAEMLLHDGCLVLFAVFLLRKTSVRPYPISLAERMRPYPICLEERMRPYFNYLSEDILKHKKETRLDLLLLGNQIPFCVLIDLHTRLKDTLFNGVNGTLEEIALSCFDDIRPSPSTSFPEPVHHLLHLFHWSRVQPGKHDQDPSARLLGEPESNLPCATWFEDSRISFSATMQLLQVHCTWTSRGTCLACESNVRSSLAVTTYSICMARLLQCEDDAKLLRKKGILAHTRDRRADHRLEVVYINGPSE